MCLHVFVFVYVFFVFICFRIVFMCNFPVNAESVPCNVIAEALAWLVCFCKATSCITHDSHGDWTNSHDVIHCTMRLCLYTLYIVVCVFG